MPQGTLRDDQFHILVNWDIEDYLSKSIDKAYLYSPPFSLSDAKWYLRLYPNGNTSDGSVGWITLHLIKSGPDCDKHRVAYTVGIKNGDGSIYKSCQDVLEFSKYCGGSHRLLESSELTKLKDVLVQDGALKVFCEARLVVKNFVETATQTVGKEGFDPILIENYQELFLSGCHSDVSFKLGEQEFQAHRSTLSAHSPVFASMFKHDTAEKKSGVVNIEDCDSNSFNEFLLFLYTGKVEDISSDKVIGLFRTADKYGVENLKIECVQYILDNVSVELLCDTVLIAVVHNESELLKAATDFFIENVQAILPTTKWQSFMKDHNTLANELLIKMINRTSSLTKN